MKKNRFKLILIILVVYLFICNISILALEKGTSEVNINVEQYAIIDIENDGIIKLNINLDEKENEYQKGSVTVKIAANSPINLKIKQKPEEFGNKLDDWLHYEYEYYINNIKMTGKFGTDQDNTSYELIPFLEYNQKELEVYAVFNNKEALEGEWWNLKADSYENIVLTLIVSANI